MIITQRLQLREFNPQVSQTIFKSYPDDEIMQFFGMYTTEELLLQKTMFKEGMVMFGKSFCYFHLIEISSGKVIGWCGYHTWYTRHNRAELGYVLNADEHKGKGYMKEALKPIIKFGFESMNLNRIEAYTSTDNTPSMKLLLGNGFQKEGILREHYRSAGKPDDSVVFALLKSEYETINK